MTGIRVTTEYSDFREGPTFRFNVHENTVEMKSSLTDWEAWLKHNEAAGINMAQEGLADIEIVKGDPTDG